MSGAANRIRIIGGRHRGRRLSFLPGRGLRPTADRVRETLFNWLRCDVADARCLDLFAGSGALGLEAVSRGAAFLCAIERQRSAARRLRENIALLGEQAVVEVVEADALQQLRESPERPFDIVFLDPPFSDAVLTRACGLLEAGGWLVDGALIYLEQDAQRPAPALPDHWAMLRQGSAGQASFRLVRRSEPG